MIPPSNPQNPNTTDVQVRAIAKPSRSGGTAATNSRPSGAGPRRRVPLCTRPIAAQSRQPHHEGAGTKFGSLPIARIEPAASPLCPDAPYIFVQKCTLIGGAKNGVGDGAASCELKAPSATRFNPATLRKLTKPVGHPWSDPPRRIRVAEFREVDHENRNRPEGSSNYVRTDLGLSPPRQAMGSLPIRQRVHASRRFNRVARLEAARSRGHEFVNHQYPRGVWYDSQGSQRKACRCFGADRRSLVVLSTRLALFIFGRTVCPRMPTVRFEKGRRASTRPAQFSSDGASGGRSFLIDQPGRKPPKRAIRFSSGDGLGIHKPRSNALGRARERVICPAVARNQFRRRTGDALFRSGESGLFVRLGSCDAGNSCPTFMRTMTDDALRRHALVNSEKILGQFPPVARQPHVWCPSSEFVGGRGVG